MAAPRSADASFAWAFPSALSLPQYRARAYEDALAEEDGLVGAAESSGGKRPRLAAAAASGTSSTAPSSEEHAAALAKARSSLVTAYAEVNVLINLVKMTRSGRGPKPSPAGPTPALFDRTAVAGIPPPVAWFDAAAVTARGMRVLTLRNAGSVLSNAADRFSITLPQRREAQRGVEALLHTGWRIVAGAAARATLQAVHDRDVVLSTWSHSHAKALSMDVRSRTCNGVRLTPHVLCLHAGTRPAYGSRLWFEFGAAMLAPIGETGRGIGVTQPPYPARSRVIAAVQARFESTGIIDEALDVRPVTRQRMEVHATLDAGQARTQVVDMIAAFRALQDGVVSSLEGADLAVQVAAACVAACVQPELRPMGPRGAGELTCEAVFITLLTQLMWTEIIGLASAAERLEGSHAFESAWPCGHAFASAVLKYSVQAAASARGWQRAQVLFSSMSVGDDGVRIAVACGEVNAAAARQLAGVLETKEDGPLPAAAATCMVHVHVQMV